MGLLYSFPQHLAFAHNVKKQATPKDPSGRSTLTSITDVGLLGLFKISILLGPVLVDPFWAALKRHLPIHSWEQECSEHCDKTPLRKFSVSQFVVSLSYQMFNFCGQYIHQYLV